MAKIIHKLKKEYVSHFVAACGRFPRLRARITDDWDAVTCKNCLKKRGMSMQRLVKNDDGRYVLQAAQSIEDAQKEIAVLKAEIDHLRESLESIVIWAKGSICEICGVKKMTDTDAYDYAQKALAGKEKP